MSRDRSLDEFVGGQRRDDDRTTAETEPDAEATNDTTTTSSTAESSSNRNEGSTDETVPGSGRESESAAVELAVSTYAFAPDGAPCAACGAVVEKRWRDDGELVCPECKAW